MIDRLRKEAARRRAYTLIELLMVIVVLGLAGALVIPKFMGIEGMEAQAAVRKIIGDLSFAQSDALAHQEYRRVHFYDDGRGYCLFRVDSTDYDTAWSDLIEDDLDYINDPLGGAGALGRYVVDFDADPRFRGVAILDVQIDGGGSGPEGDIVYDDLAGTLRGGGLPGTGGTIQVGSGAQIFTITLAPFTGKLTVTE